MKIEQLLQTKSKEENAFILYKGKNYKIPCVECSFFQADKNGAWKCFSLFELQCRKEFYKWLEKEI